MNNTKYNKGLHDIGNGIYAYLQPDGSWGWSNAGLITDCNESLLVDTLYDQPLTATMLKAMKDATGIEAKEINTLVNTHANGDHTWGNGLVRNAEIITSKQTAEQMLEEISPQMMVNMLLNAKNMGEAGEFILENFSGFAWEGLEVTMPTKTFEGELDLKVGHKSVKLKNVGPAHTDGDTLVYVPDDKVIYTGDILFIDGTPVIWSGPTSNWIKACDYILSLDVDVIVPGHGPITDKNGVRQVRDYLNYISVESRRRFDAGMNFYEAANDIALGDFGKWTDTERIVINVFSQYKEFNKETTKAEVPDIIELLKLMQQYKNNNSLKSTHSHNCCENH